MGKIPMVTTLCQMSDHVTTSDGCASANLSLQGIKKNFPLIIISETCGLMVRCVQVKEVTVCLQKVNQSHFQYYYYHLSLCLLQQ